jgi:DNA polymerase-3 subunit gamma/tau
MTLLRMVAFRPAGTPAAGSARQRPRTQHAAQASLAQRQRAQPQPSTAGVGDPLPSPGQALDVPGAAAPATAAPAEAAADDSWTALVRRLDLQGAARQLASHCSLIERRGSLIRLALDPRNQLMRTPAQEEKLAQALSRELGGPVRLEFEIIETPAETPAQAERRVSVNERESVRQALESDPTVRALRERLGATLLPESVRPNK